MKGLSTVMLRMGSAEHKVHIIRVCPLLMRGTQNPVVEPDCTPPLFMYEHAQEQSETMNTDAEHDIPSLVLLHHQSNRPYPVITTHSGQVIKPVQWFDRTED